METLNQLNAGVTVAQDHDHVESGPVDEKNYEPTSNEKQPLDANEAGSPPPTNNGDDTQSVFRKLTSRQELVVFSACCISLFRG
jgi:hypothetical protein